MDSQRLGEPAAVGLTIRSHAKGAQFTRADGAECRPRFCVASPTIRGRIPRVKLEYQIPAQWRLLIEPSASSR